MPFSLQMSAAAAFVDGALYVMPPVAGDSELAKARRCYDVWPKRGNNGVPLYVEAVAACPALALAKEWGCTTRDIYSLARLFWEHSTNNYKGTADPYKSIRAMALERYRLVWTLKK